MENGLRDEKTYKAMYNPKVGDRFQEMYNFWVYIINVNRYFVSIASASSPCTFPEDAEFEELTHWQFRKKFSYDKHPSSNRFWIRFLDHGNDVSGWYEELKLRDIEQKREWEST